MVTDPKVPAAGANHRLVKSSSLDAGLAATEAQGTHLRTGVPNRRGSFGDTERAREAQAAIVATLKERKLRDH